MPTKLADLRKDYTLAGLAREDLLSDPVRQLQRWLEQALSANIREPNAMVLATLSEDGCPRSRVVLLKNLDQRGLIFYTNRESRKSRDLLKHPQASVTFPWIDLERQVHVRGTVTEISREESEAYFRSRPRGNQIGAWTSPQSQAIPDRATLEKKSREIEKTYAGKDIPLPPFWGGFLLAPRAFEFWQGRSNRLHDRFVYEREETSPTWQITRLAP